jgi:GNAT superfamily N-acetyltransferase
VELVSLHSKEQIEKVLRRNVFLHIYGIGDLDDFFWPRTVWYGLADGVEVREIILLYTAFRPPVMLALSEKPALMSELLHHSLSLLPKRIYAHLSLGLRSALIEDYNIQSHGVYLKMALADPTRLQAVDTSTVVPLSPPDLPDLQELYCASYPANSFDPRMLETNLYFGVRRDNQLVCVAGLHVYSPKYRVAALGNVTTHPDFRGQGLATAACAKLCLRLLETTDHIGLNVKADNSSAIKAYQRLGFEPVATYEECSLELKLT